MGVLETVFHTFLLTFVKVTFDNGLGYWYFTVETLSPMVEITFLCLDELSRACSPVWVSCVGQ